MLLRAPAAIWLQMILPGSVKNVAPALMQRILDALRCSPLSLFIEDCAQSLFVMPQTEIVIFRELRLLEAYRK